MIKPETNDQYQEKGFTIIELLIALGVFSVILMIIVTGYVQVTKIYQRGIAGRETQQSARFIIDDMSKSVRASTSIKSATVGNRKYLCLDNIRYVWNGGNYTLKKERIDDTNKCADVDNASDIISSEFLVRGGDGKLAVREFEAVPFHPDNSGDFRSVELRVLIATRVGEDLFMGNNQCDLSKAGVEFCSTTELNSIVSLRRGAGKLWQEYQN